jgi:hypothetical protein
MGKPIKEQSTNEAEALQVKDKTVTFSRDYMLALRKAPLSQVRPTGMAYIPGVTAPKLRAKL